MSGSIAYNPWSDEYQVTFAGKTIETTVTKSASTITDWINQIPFNTLTTNQVVGLDLEWRPHPVRSMSNTTATLQLCVDTKCLIVQLFYVDFIPQSLKDFLSSSAFTFVGVEVADDARKLKSEYGLECNKTDDVRAAAMRKWPYRFRRPGLKDLAFDLLGLRMDKTKRVTLTDWQAEVLTMDQIQYACIDAYASFRLGHLLFN
ncbi:3'-5' exonuclease-like [Silene latifolia]|uniref:3'-5' exonuclease-like n=1 Tax=Silene latifolia TaxID=37657 RepID=UPI003D776B20